MTTKLTRENDPNFWIQCGIPEELSRYIAEFPRRENHPVIQRARRFRQYWVENPDDEEVPKAWANLERNAKKDDHDGLIALFLLLPDEPTDQPFPALYGKRAKNPDAERDDYAKQLECIKEIKQLFEPLNPKFENLIRDASATESARTACADLLQTMDRVAVWVTLNKLEALLEIVDPFAKIPIKQWAAEDKAEQIYARLVANLSKYLKVPKWEALATIANINCPTYSVSAAALRMASKRNANRPL